MTNDQLGFVLSRHPVLDDRLVQAAAFVWLECQVATSVVRTRGPDGKLVDRWIAPAMRPILFSAAVH